MSETEKSDHCECCYYETEELELSCEGPGLRRIWLCFLCRDSLAGNVAIYRTIYSRDLLMIVGVIMNAANHIIKELRKATPEGTAKP